MHERDPQDQVVPEHADKETGQLKIEGLYQSSSSVYLLRTHDSSIDASLFFSPNEPSMKSIQKILQAEL